MADFSQLSPGPFMKAPPVKAASTMTNAKQALRNGGGLLATRLE
jgi:hypothetical protein